MFKTEMHLHTGNVSTCAHATAEEAIEKYIEYGYSTIVTTEHINPWTFPRELEASTWKSRVDHFMNGYNKLLEAADGRINVLLGAEVRFMRENNSDYLVYGLTEDFLLECGDPRRINSIHAFSNIVHEHGLMIFQAHPFRPDMMVTHPSLLDGVEVANMSPWHNSHNNIARMWAEENDMIGICGTDFHNADHTPLGGILTDNEIKDSETLMNVLKSRDFKLICDVNE